MSVERNIRFDLIARLCPNATGAELRSVCTEAGMFAIRSRRKVASEADFLARWVATRVLSHLYQVLMTILDNWLAVWRRSFARAASSRRRVCTRNISSLSKVKQCILVHAESILLQYVQMGKRHAIHSHRRMQISYRPQENINVMPTRDPTVHMRTKSSSKPFLV